MNNTLDDRNGADEAASEWAVRLVAGPLEGVEEKAFAEWLAMPGNEARLAHYQKVYLALGQNIPRMVEEGKLGAEVVRPDRRVFLRWASGLASAAAIIVAGIWWTGRPEVHATAVAQRTQFDLADGSHVELNARTSVAVQLQRDGRHVRLEEGEAFFHVAKDPARPFWVETKAGTVRVTGTQFNVRSEGPGQLEVTVLEGSVAVSPGAVDAGGFALVANDQLAFDGARTGVKKLSEAGTADALAWRDGWVVFDKEPLASAVQRFARYHGRQIEVAPETAQLELGGRFKLDELDEFLRDVGQTLPVLVLKQPDGRIQVRAR